MKGHIRKRGKNSWAVVIFLGRDPDGKQHRKWHTVRGTRRDAQRELARLMNEINTGAYVEPARISLAEYLDRWLLDYAKPKVAGTTYDRYQEMIESHIKPALGTYALPKLAPLHIQGFYSRALASGRKDGKGGLSPQTVLHFHRLLHKALAQAVKWQLLARNPVDAVEPPKPKPQEMQVLDEGETATLLRQLEGSRLYVPVLLAVTTGLRRGEILGLRWADVDLARKSITVAQSLERTVDGLKFKSPKTHRSRRAVSLPAMTVEALRAHRAKQGEERLMIGADYDDNDLVCPGLGGSPWRPDVFSASFAKAIRRMAIRQVRFHDLRHSHATHLLRAGVHPKVVSERLGHSRVGITLDTYSHVLPGMQQDAANLIDAALVAAIRHDKALKE